MSNLERRSDNRPVIGFGPKIPGSGSWEWVGADIAESLSERWNVKVFNEQIPDCDLYVFIKFKPRPDILREIAQRSSIIYCPIDFYSSAAEIDNDSASLLRCQRVLIHCERLRRYFAPYAAVDYIESHMGEDLSLDCLAVAAAMSPFRFARAFKNATGRAPRQYVTARRMQRARELLRSPRHDIAEVAYRVGFATQSHFTAVFHRHCGITPRRFRDSRRS